MKKGRKTIRRKIIKGKKRYTRRSRKIGGQEVVQQNVQNIEQQIAFVKENAEEFSKIQINPEDFIQMMQTVLEYTKSHNGELPPDVKQNGIGSVALLQQQINKIEDKIEEIIQKCGLAF